MLFLDTNILVRLFDVNSIHHSRVRSYLSELSLQNTRCAVNLQVVSEFWVVVTRPADLNGFGWTPADAATALNSLKSRYTVLPDSHDTADVWLQLVSNNNIRGKRAHDARIAAAVIAHGIDAIVTLNSGDFSGFGVKIITP